MRQHPGSHRSPAEEKTDASGLSGIIADLEAMDLHALRRCWIRLHGERPPDAFSKQLLALALAYRAQEKVLGGIDPATRAILRSHAGRGHRNSTFIKPGSILVREYHGVVHQVEVVSGGFRWNGQTWTSLTTIAQAITGTKWNGPRFFGLRNAGASAPRQQGAPS